MGITQFAILLVDISPGSAGRMNFPQLLPYRRMQRSIVAAPCDCSELHHFSFLIESNNFKITKFRVPSAAFLEQFEKRVLQSYHGCCFNPFYASEGFSMRFRFDDPLAHFGAASLCSIPPLSLLQGAPKATRS